MVLVEDEHGNGDALADEGGSSSSGVRLPDHVPLMPRGAAADDAMDVEDEEHTDMQRAVLASLEGGIAGVDVREQQALLEAYAREGGAGREERGVAGGEETPLRVGDVVRFHGPEEHGRMLEVEEGAQGEVRENVGEDVVGVLFEGHAGAVYVDVRHLRRAAGGDGGQERARRG